MSLTLPPIAPGHGLGSGPAMVSPPGWKASDVGFGDVLEALNPLQYVPVVGTIYREVTGDEVHPALRIAVSGVLSLVFGGPIGLAATMLSTVVGEVLRGDRATASAKAGSATPAQWNVAASAYHRVVRDT